MISLTLSDTDGSSLVNVSWIVMDAEATKPPDTADTVIPHSGSVTGLQNKNQQNKQCAQETSPSLELESVEGMEPKGTETLNADANTQNAGPAEGAGAAEFEDQTQRVEVKIPKEHARLEPLLSQTQRVEVKIPKEHARLEPLLSQIQGVEVKIPKEHARLEPLLSQIQGVEVKIPKEHARLEPLLSQIPKKAQHGLLMQCDLILTCIDATDLYIALGTNIGLTFLYNRQDHSMQRLKSEVVFLSCFFFFVRGGGGGGGGGGELGGGGDWLCFFFHSFSSFLLFFFSFFFPPFFFCI